MENVARPNMASYLSSYFGTSAAASTQSTPQSQYSSGPATQSSGTWTSTFSSRVSALRKALTKDSEEDDPDNEDCSHVSNVLRAYYTEKGRPFPEWLPPDPTKPAVQAQQPVYGQYGNIHPTNYTGGSSTHSRASSAGKAGLSDLWDAGPAQPASQVQSLRAQRLARDKANNVAPGLNGARTSLGPRPMLPSQHSSGSQGNIGSAPGLPTLASRDRLRARLQGGASGRQSPGTLSSGDPYSGAGGVYRSQSNSNDYNTTGQNQQAYTNRSASNADAYDPYSHQSRPR